MSTRVVYRKKKHDSLLALLGDDKKIVLARTRGETRAIIIEVTKLTIGQQENTDGDQSSE